MHGPCREKKSGGPHGVTPLPILGVDLEILLKFSRGGPEIFFNFGGDLNLGGELNFRGGAGR